MKAKDKLADEALKMYYDSIMAGVVVDHQWADIVRWLEAIPGKIDSLLKHRSLKRGERESLRFYSEWSGNLLAAVRSNDMAIAVRFALDLGRSTTTLLGLAIKPQLERAKKDKRDRRSAQVKATESRRATAKGAKWELDAKVAQIMATSHRHSPTDAIRLAANSLGISESTALRRLGKKS